MRSRCVPYTGRDAGHIDFLGGFLVGRRRRAWACEGDGVPIFRDLGVAIPISVYAGMQKIKLPATVSGAVCLAAACRTMRRDGKTQAAGPDFGWTAGKAPPYKSRKDFQLFGAAGRHTFPLFRLCPWHMISGLGLSLIAALLSGMENILFN